MKYRKKPVVIEAVRNDGEWAPILEWLDSLSVGGLFRLPIGYRPPIDRNPDGTLNIHTPEGVMRADVGDWVIRGVQGEFYPGKPDVFEATYEPANPETPAALSIPWPPDHTTVEKVARAIADAADAPLETDWDKDQAMGAARAAFGALAGDRS